MMSISSNSQGEKVVGEISEQEHLIQIHYRNDQSASLGHKEQVRSIQGELLLQIIFLPAHSTNT